MADFECEKCGLCCKKINCMHLTENNLCAIYDTRPLVCNVDEGYKVFFAKVMSRKEYDIMNQKVCKTLQQEN